MKVLALTKYSRIGASSRLRTLQYLPLLEEQGFEFTVQSLFDDDYLKNLYSRNVRSKAVLGNLYSKRLLTLFTVKNYDVIWIEKEISPYLPAFAEKALALLGIKYVVDYDDAIFHNYDLSNNKLVKFFLANKIDKVMKNASYVLAGNSYLAERARWAGAKKIQLLPTVVDHLKYKKNNRSDQNVLTVGWIGSPSTQKYVIEILPELLAAYQEYPFRLLLVGATADISNELIGLDVDIRDWHEQTEADLIGLMDIGIMPLKDGPWEKGKCGYKLIQYMACEVPVIASDVGVNSEVIEGDAAGLLARKQSDWSQALLKLLASAELRRNYGKAGRAIVENKYSIEAQLPVLTKVLNSLAK
tara:strand:+ start:20447 stop:21517 length:1071 start_codon:yes stop_codon:yes gene_type:complete